MHEFACDVCGSPAVTYPAVLEDDAPVVCARCEAPVATYGEFRRRVEGILDASRNHQAVTGC